MNAGPQTERFPLQALARRIRETSQNLPFARPVGEIRAIGQSAVEIGGLSRWLHLGSRVEIATKRGPELAEVIRLDQDRALCRPYDARANIALTDNVYPRGQLTF